MTGALILPVPELAHQMGLIPVLWLAFLRLRGKPPAAELWWIATGLAVSWLADTSSHWMGHLPVSALYPVTQSAMVCLVFLNRRESPTLIATLGALGIVAILWQGFLTGWPQYISSRDVLIHTVACLTVVGIVWPLSPIGRMHTALLVYFGLGWLAWIAYTLDPFGVTWAPQQLVRLADQTGGVLDGKWITWSVYELTRLAGITLFCVAATSDSNPHPRLKIITLIHTSPRLS